MTLRMIFLVGIGGFIGTVARFLSATLITNQFAIPGLSTLIVNILGSFIIGLVYGLGIERFDQATITIPVDGFMQSGSREGKHTEHLGYLLAEMQYLPRAYPDAKW